MPIYLTVMCIFVIELNVLYTAIHAEESSDRYDVTTPDTSNVPVTSSINNGESSSTAEAVNNRCPSHLQCSQLSGDCIYCDFNQQCFYGREDTVTCRPKPLVVCQGEQEFHKTFVCQYCFQTRRYLQTCTSDTSCKAVSAPLEYYQANCTVNDDVICLGRRQFHRLLRCNWTSGKRWSIALILSITLGGFGADRFYLGHWQAGIGKLFSVGGLGVWTLVDVVLVATGYAGPADGSLYI